ncbi:MAG: winged helix-turn-helix transcriptional regulator [Lachnospiraceae bacterium]|nr:winged helix-turn-helix transcriptional regulator [Lachnospiraceae bacterium]
MERNYDKEIDELKEQMKNLQNMVSPQLDELRAMMMELHPNKSSTEKLKRVHVMHGMHPDSRLSEQMEELCFKTEEKGGSGFVTYLGLHNSGGRQSNWIRNSVPTDDLLSLIESGVANKVLACIGNSNRLAMVLEILRGPKTVASLVEKCGFGSTGQVYHHLKPLLAADIVVEDEHQKGFYIIQPHKVQGIIMLLAGISDMVDETYTKGTWETDEEN